MDKLTASDILNRLAIRHQKDVFIVECKTGSSWINPEMQMIDAWAMAKSWAHPLVTAYEVKVDRGDFTSDTKWNGYLAYCNCFYFICPKGLIQPEELGAECGLIWASEKNLSVKRKAPHRFVTIPESLYRYVLMSRVKIQQATYSADDSNVSYKKEYWKRWMEDAKIDHQFGWNVSKRIREVVEKRIDEVDSKNRILQNKHAEYDAIRQFIVSLGLPGDHPSRWSVKDIVERMAGLCHVDQSVSRRLTQAIGLLKSVAEDVRMPTLTQSVSASAYKLADASLSKVDAADVELTSERVTAAEATPRTAGRTSGATFI